MRLTRFIIISSFVLIAVGISACPDSFLRILSEVKDQFQMDLFIVLATNASPMADQLLPQLHENLSVQIVRYSNLWDPPRTHIGMEKLCWKNLNAISY